MMKWFTRAMIVVLALASTQCKMGKIEGGRAEGTPQEYRMAWIMPFMGGDNPIDSPEAIARAVSEAREGYLNALLPVTHRRGCSYYQSEFLPMYPPGEPPDFDALAEFIKTAHDTSDGKRYVEIHPWLVIFPVWMERDKVPPENHIARLHPEWRMDPYDRAKLKDDEQFWLDPGVPEVEEYYIKVCREVVSKYDVDGLNLDYIRYREGGYGYNPISLKRFQKRFGRTDIPDPKDEQWNEWRREQITNLVRRIYVEAHQLKPRINLSICGITWDPPTKGFEQTSTYWNVAQNWPAWLKEGIVDMVITMNYRRTDDEATRAGFGIWTDYLVGHRSGRLVVNGLGVYLNTIQGTLEQVLESQMLGTDGVCFFRFSSNTRTEGTPRGELYRWLRESLFRVPASVPPAPWLEKQETAMLCGTVYGVGGKPLDGAEVTLTGTDKRVTTSGTGYYAFVGLKPGTYELSVRQDSYRYAVPEKVQVQAAEIKSFQIRMQ
jgi:uncharacterized lipoprotein YddW (UPF0748 family)